MIPILVSSKDIKWNAAEYAANSAVQQTWARELIANSICAATNTSRCRLRRRQSDGGNRARRAARIGHWHGRLAGDDRFAQKTFPAKKFRI